MYDGLSLNRPREEHLGGGGVHSTAQHSMPVDMMHARWRFIEKRGEGHKGGTSRVRIGHTDPSSFSLSISFSLSLSLRLPGFSLVYIRIDNINK